MKRSIYIRIDIETLLAGQRPVVTKHISGDPIGETPAPDNLTLPEIAGITARLHETREIYVGAIFEAAMEGAKLMEQTNAPLPPGTILRANGSPRLN